MKKAPYFYYAENEYWSSTRMIGMVIGVILMLLVFGAILFSCDLQPANADEIPTKGFATYYTVASCLNESGQYRMANGRLLNDKAYTAASWYYRFGTKVKITNQANGKFVICTITDRGPSKRLVRKGKIIDLSLAAFKSIADLKKGVIAVTVEVVG